MPKVPSGFLYQPSKAAVMLWPESCFGSRGSCACARTSVDTSVDTARMSARATGAFDILVTGALRECPVFGEPILVVLLGDVRDVYPRVRHLIDRAIAPAYPLQRIGIVGVRRRIV